MVKEIPKVYQDLANRNGWYVSYGDDRLYFMAKSGGYATPDDNVTDEDKELLADYISEGSSEMKNIILNCWSNDLRISGPCSGIPEFHNYTPSILHFGIFGPKKVIEPLYQSLQEIFPNAYHLVREEKNGELRYDFDCPLIKHTKEESDNIFSIYNDELNKVLENIKTQNNIVH